MKIPLRINFLNIPPSDAIESEIRKRAEKLDQFYEHMMHCEVTVDVPGKHKKQGRLYDIRIDLTVPGAEIAISRVHRNEDVYAVIRDAFEAAIRKLQDKVRCRRGDVKLHEAPLHGRVTKLHEDGHGFIETPDGNEFYFHRENVAHPDFDQIGIGVEVRFLAEPGSEGLQAKRVSAGRHHLPHMPE
ncbi:MAG: 30S ribosomal protein S30 [Burkholderiales bacterium RIFCSPLOWO2_02_FULL_57_36]|nr:MAG: 30S ribosomal protein S30 [Burkholderiales bacterium RIFCSPLOWO2_02_FULL_57_36]